MTRRTPASCCLVIGVSLLSPLAHAQGSPNAFSGSRTEASPAGELIQVDYEAAAGCPSYEAFIENVRTYTTRWTLAGAGEDARRFQLKLVPRDGKVLGTLEISQKREGAGTATREIAGPDCETVARGMAVAVAVAIDPEALLSDRSVTEPAPSPAPPPPVLPARVVHEPPAPERSSKKTSAQLAIDVRAEVTSAVVVGWLPVVSAAIELDPLSAASREPSWPLPSWLRPSFALGVRQSLPKEVDRSSVRTDFLWTSAVVRLCPARLGIDAGRIEITPCIEGDVGVLRADASGSADARRTSNLWLDGGLSARATWRPSGPWFVGATAFVVLPVTRNRFELATRELVSRAPRIGATFGLSGGVEF
jgi:hypothetical protein